MAFLGLTDIKFVTPDKRTEKTNVAVNSLVYPRNLGSADRGHYVIIHINEFADPDGAEVMTTAQKNAQMMTGSGKLQTVNSVVGGVNSLLGAGTYYENDGTMSTSGTNPLPNFLKTSGVKDVVSTLISGANRIFNPAQRYKRTDKSIALYMPNTLQFDYRQTYSGISGTEALGKVGMAVQAGSSLIDTGININSLTNQKSFIGELARDIIGRTGNIGGFVGGDFGNLLQQAGFGSATNPQVELLYSNPELRTFDFTFVFYPESAQEYKEIDMIISELKYHSAPEIQANSYGRYFTPPGSFDIEFIYNGLPNKNIPKISTAVLEQIQVNYAPNGYSAYEINPGEQGFGEKGDGAPTSISLTLQFRELEIMHKDLLDMYNSEDGNIF